MNPEENMPKPGAKQKPPVQAVSDNARGREQQDFNKEKSVGALTKKIPGCIFAEKLKLQAD